MLFPKSGSWFPNSVKFCLPLNIENMESVLGGKLEVNSPNTFAALADAVTASGLK